VVHDQRRPALSDSRASRAQGPPCETRAIDGLGSINLMGELIDVLRGTDGDEPCPNFNPGSVNTVAWWSRRQMDETTVHRWDVERALECTTPIDPIVAADGIDEYLDVFVRTPIGERAHWVRDIAITS